MTTITVVKKNGYAAIAADTLTKHGSQKEPAAYVLNNQKIIPISDSYLAISGPTSAKLALKSYFAQAADAVCFDSVESIFETWLILHHRLKSRYYLNPHEDAEDSFESTRMDVLIASPYGIFGVAAHRAVQEFSRFYASGYGDQYALGAMYAAYDDPAKSAQKVAELGVRAAAEFDDSTGLPVISFTVPLI